MAGGLCRRLLAIVSPQIMSSGHGALRVAGMLDLSFRAVALSSCSRCWRRSFRWARASAAACSFHRSLIGALGGHLLAVALTMILPTLYFDPNAVRRDRHERARGHR